MIRTPGTFGHLRNGTFIRLYGLAESIDQERCLLNITHNGKSSSVSFRYSNFKSDLTIGMYCCVFGMIEKDHIVASEISVITTTIQWANIERFIRLTDTILGYK